MLPYKARTIRRQLLFGCADHLDLQRYEKTTLTGRHVFSLNPEHHYLFPCARDLFFICYWPV
jgi:hypothetical protein